MASQNPVSPLAGANHDLWVIPPASHSRWHAHIDWYLNWQMSKGLSIHAQKPALELLKVLEDVGVAYQPIGDTSGGPLLVASAGKVGAERCLVVDFKTDFNAWLTLVHKLCADLQCQRIKVFLPKGINLADANARWTKLPPLKIQLEFTLDEENV